jgi:hypothetical protein
MMGGGFFVSKQVANESSRPLSQKYIAISSLYRKKIISIFHHHPADLLPANQVSAAVADS